MWWACRKGYFNAAKTLFKGVCLLRTVFQSGNNTISLLCVCWELYLTVATILFQCFVSAGNCTSMLLQYCFNVLCLLGTAPQCCYNTVSKFCVCWELHLNVATILFQSFVSAGNCSSMLLQYCFNVLCLLGTAPRCCYNTVSKFCVCWELHLNVATILFQNFVSAGNCTSMLLQYCFKVLCLLGTAPQCCYNTVSMFCVCWELHLNVATILFQCFVSAGNCTSMLLQYCSMEQRMINNGHKVTITAYCVSIGNYFSEATQLFQCCVSAENRTSMWLQHCFYVVCLLETVHQ